MIDIILFVLWILSIVSFSLILTMNTERKYAIPIATTELLASQTLVLIYVFQAKEKHLIFIGTIIFLLLALCVAGASFFVSTKVTEKDKTYLIGSGIINLLFIIPSIYLLFVGYKKIKV